MWRTGDHVCCAVLGWGTRVVDHDASDIAQGARAHRALLSSHTNGIQDIRHKHEGRRLGAGWGWG